MATGPATADVSHPYQAPAIVRRFGRGAALVGIGVATYLVALVATVPARLLWADASGTIWHGTAALPGAARLEWRWHPLRSLAGFGLAARWTVKGPDRLLSGNALVGRSGLTLDAVRGEADASLLSLLDLPFTCSMPMRVDIAHLAIGGSVQTADGVVHTVAGNCAVRGGGDSTTTVPPLVIRSETPDHVAVAPAGVPGDRLVTLTLGREGAVEIDVPPAGAAALPFVAPPTGLSIATRL